jgi:acetyl-CoA C-acetyltransferase
MARKVAIIAAAQTRYKARKLSSDDSELVWEVVEKVTQDTGLTWADRVTSGFGIDSIVSCSEDTWDATVISNFRVQRELGAHGMPETKVLADGTQAVYLAMIEILSGRYDVVLAAGHRKESVTVRSIVENCGLDPIYMRPLGLDYLVAAAMQAKRYMYKYGTNEEQCAKVVIKNRKNGKNNPYAQLHEEVTLQDVLSSQVIAEPIKLLDAKPVSDGACAMILASEEKAKKITSKPVWVTGIGNCYDLHYLGDRDLADCGSLEMAAKRAYAMAGIKDPKREIDVAEICDEYSYQELMWSEGLGFCEKGKGGELIDSGATRMGGQIAINPSGGLLSGVPSGVAGMSRVAEAFLQLRQEAVGRQIEGAKIALAQGATGACGQSQCVIILSK